MYGPDNLAIEVHLDDSGALDSMAREVHRGLTSRPKRLPSKYFYDERGSRLFEKITGLPEYYLTRAESKLLRRRAGEIARRTEFHELVELGAGSAKKTRLLIEAGLAQGTLRRYLPVDVSLQQARATASAVAARYPELEVHAVVGDIERHLTDVPAIGNRLVAFLGSTIGNFTDEEAVVFLRKTHAILEYDDWLLLGTDLVKEPEVLEAAYNDSQGVTAEFNCNILNVINRHLDGDFDPDAFEHVSYYNPRASRIETYLRPRSDQIVRLDAIDLEIEFERGELMRTEVSCKYTEESARQLLARAGFDRKHWFTDEDRTFALSLSRPLRTG
jgi:L-histidine N-alpha-methyltransferase